MAKCVTTLRHFYHFVSSVSGPGNANTRLTVWPSGCNSMGMTTIIKSDEYRRFVYAVIDEWISEATKDDNPLLENALYAGRAAVGGDRVCGIIDTHIEVLTEWVADLTKDGNHSVAQVFEVCITALKGGK